ncbi:MAG TPA: DedA family protein [Noviherbaspirillum sp.]|nr:DedA family protein [Noviherbaspirillum sp.]
MSLAQFIHEYGYFAVAIGSFLEGEAVLLAGSFAAYAGHLDLPLVLAIAALASFLGDLPYFFAGRRYGSAVLQRFPALHARKGRLDKLLQRHHVLLVLSLRFLYGLRIAGLLTLGMSRMSAWRFLALDFLGAVIWSSTVCATGYGVGRLAQAMFGDISTGEQISLLLAVLVCASLLIMLARRRLALAGVDRPPGH